MIRAIISTFILLVFAISGFSQSPVNVDAQKFNELIHAGNGVVLDVRTPQEYARGHIDGSTLINISDREFQSKIQLLQKDKPIYIYCLTGSRSRVAANYMAQTGFSKIYNLQAGILDWQRCGFTTVKSELTAANSAKQYSVADFQNLLTSENLVLIDFNAPWCAPCKQMAPIIDKLAINLKGKVKVEKIDVESNRQLAMANQVNSIPGFILFKNGKQVWTHKGIISYDELSGVIAKNL